MQQADTSNSTPLHFAASSGDLHMVHLLLECDASAAHLKDKDGLTPIHVAASMGHVNVIRELILLCPDSDELVDVRGRSFLHIAIEKKRPEVVKYVLKMPTLEELLNLQDYEGNTPLHLATITRNQQIVQILLADRRVHRSRRNNKNLTPLDLASSNFEPVIGLRMYKTMVSLVSSGSRFSAQRQDHLANNIHSRMQEEELTRYRALAKNLAIVAVLIATVTFAAAFTLPGGYRGENGGSDQGMAILTWKAAFKVFLVSDTAAMVSAITGTCLLIYTGSVDHDVRLHSLSTAMRLMWVALGGMVLAFASGVYVVVASDCFWLAVLVCVMACSGPLAAWVLSSWPTFSSMKWGKAAGGYTGFKAVEHHISQDITNFRTPEYQRDYSRSRSI